MTRVAVAVALAFGVQGGVRAASDTPSVSVSTGFSADLTAQSRPSVMLVQAGDRGLGLGVLALALPMPVRPDRPVEATAELPPCQSAESPAIAAAEIARETPGTNEQGMNEQGEAAPANGQASISKNENSTPAGRIFMGTGNASEHIGDASIRMGDASPIQGQDGASSNSDPSGAQMECTVIPIVGPDATADPIAPSLDYIPPAPGTGKPVKWGRPLGASKPWFAGVSSQEGMVEGDRSLTYRSVEGPSVSVGSLTPFAPAWSNATPIGGVQISNLTSASDVTVPEGKLGYSSMWGHINNTDPAITSGGMDYGAPAGTSSLRYGLLRDVTLESQVQSARGLTATGLGTIYSMGQWGTLQGGATQSHFDDAEGWRYRLGYNVDVFDSLTLGYANEQTSSGYGDLSTYQDGVIGSRQLRNTFSAGVPIGGWGTLSGTYSGLRDTSGATLERRFGLTQSMLLSPNVRFAVGADRDVISGDYAVNVQLTLPLGGR